MSVATQPPAALDSSMQGAYQAYVDAGMPLGVPHIEIATWIVNNGLFDVPFDTKLKHCDKLLAAALPTITRTDPQGRKVRKLLAYRGPWTDMETGKERQTWLWDDVFTCTADQGHAGLRAMRKGIGCDVVALAKLQASINDNNPNMKDNPIQLSWDFTDEVEGENGADDEAPTQPR